MAIVYAPRPSFEYWVVVVVDGGKRREGREGGVRESQVAVVSVSDNFASSRPGTLYHPAP